MSTLSTHDQVAVGTLKFDRGCSGKMRIQGNLFDPGSPNGGENSQRLQVMDQLKAQKSELSSKCIIFDRTVPIIRQNTFINWSNE
jgi:hypothetical protein